MSYKFVVEDKLHWTFRLYDQDGSGEIDPDEMELIFTKFCKICESTEVNRYKIKTFLLQQDLLSLFVRSSCRISQLYLIF